MTLDVIVHLVVEMRTHRTAHPLYTIIKKYTPLYAFYLKAPNSDGIVTRYRIYCSKHAMIIRNYFNANLLLTYIFLLTLFHQFLKRLLPFFKAIL